MVWECGVESEHPMVWECEYLVSWSQTLQQLIVTTQGFGSVQGYLTTTEIYLVKNKRQNLQRASQKFPLPTSMYILEQHKIAYLKTNHQHYTIFCSEVTNQWNGYV